MLCLVYGNFVAAALGLFLILGWKAAATRASAPPDGAASGAKNLIPAALFIATRPCRPWPGSDHHAGERGYYNFEVEKYRQLVWILDAGGTGRPNCCGRPGLTWRNSPPPSGIVDIVALAALALIGTAAWGWARRRSLTLWPADGENEVSRMSGGLSWPRFWWRCCRSAAVRDSRYYAPRLTFQPRAARAPCFRHRRRARQPAPQTRLPGHPAGGCLVSDLLVGLPCLQLRAVLLMEREEFMGLDLAMLLKIVYALGMGVDRLERSILLPEVDDKSAEKDRPEPEDALLGSGPSDPVAGGFGAAMAGDAFPLARR